MTPEQAAAYVMSQAACAACDLAAMQARNASDVQAGRPLTHGPEDFESIPERHVIGHNAVLTVFREATRG